MLAVALVLLTPALAAPLCAQQTQFGAEESIQQPVPLPSGALAVLRSAAYREILQYCADEADMKVNEIPADWFTASELELKPGVTGLIVRGEGQCLRGAHITQFWVLVPSASLWRLVFSGRGDSLNVLKTRTNHVRDLHLVLMMGAGRTVEYVKFRYSRGKYRKMGTRVVEHE